MKTYLIYIFSISLFLYGQCGENQVELWENCYAIESTYELNLSNQGIEGNIPENISLLQNLLFLDLSGNNLEGDIPNQLYNLNNLL